LVGRFPPLFSAGLVVFFLLLRPEETPFPITDERSLPAPCSLPASNWPLRPPCFPGKAPFGAARSAHFVPGLPPSGVPALSSRLPTPNPGVSYASPEPHLDCPFGVLNGFTTSVSLLPVFQFLFLFACGPIYSTALCKACPSQFVHPKTSPSSRRCAPPSGPVATSGGCPLEFFPLVPQMLQSKPLYPPLHSPLRADSILWFCSFFSATLGAQHRRSFLLIQHCVGHSVASECSVIDWILPLPLFLSPDPKPQYPVFSDFSFV